MQTSDDAPGWGADSARDMRVEILNMVFHANSGHIDSSFSIVEILTALYGAILRVRPDQPDWPERDRLVLSKGHAAPALYAALSMRGFFARSELGTLRTETSVLQGHPRLSAPGVDAPTGSLGQGLSLAAGMSYAARNLGRSPDARVFAILSDGELNEGQTWEAIMFAGHQRLSGLCMIIDLNGLQYSGATKDVLRIPGLVTAIEAFGWDVTEVDGHSIPQLTETLARTSPAPLAVVAHTIKGKGVSFLENDLKWHGKVPSRDEYLLALGELTGSRSSTSSPTYA
jgi:transketolase